MSAILEHKLRSRKDFQNFSINQGSLSVRVFVYHYYIIASLFAYSSYDSQKIFIKFGFPESAENSGLAKPGVWLVQNSKISGDILF